jgi:hypothetical protein
MRGEIERNMEQHVLRGQRLQIHQRKTIGVLRWKMLCWYLLRWKAVDHM